MSASQPHSVLALANAFSVGKGICTCSAVRVRWSHICGYNSNNVPQCHFVLVHFIFALYGCDVAEIGMRPGV
jgi:hypothetical protein